MKTKVKKTIRKREHPDRREALVLMQRGLDWFHGQGNTKEAAACFRRAISVDGGLAAAHTNLGVVLTQNNEEKEDISKAQLAFERALELDPDQSEARYNLANLLSTLALPADWERAAAEYRHILRDQPEFGDAHYNLALTLIQLGHPGAATPHFKSFLEFTEMGESTTDISILESIRIAQQQIQNSATP